MVAFNRNEWCIHMSVGINDIYLSLIEIKYYKYASDERSVLL